MERKQEDICKFSKRKTKGDSDLAKNWLDKAITSDEVNADFDKAITNIEQILAQDNVMSPFTL